VRPRKWTCPESRNRRLPELCTGRGEERTEKLREKKKGLNMRLANPYRGVEKRENEGEDKKIYLSIYLWL
jgi:hypothetical protein